MKKTQRWLCMLLVLCMLLSVLPVTASAEDALVEGNSNTKTIQVEDCDHTSSGSWDDTGTRKPDKSAASGNKTFLYWKTRTFNEQSPQSITFTLTGLEAGATYKLSVTTKDDKNRAKFQFSVNGTNVGSEVDLFLNQANGEFRSHELGVFTVSANETSVQLTATLTGRNSQNPGYQYGGAFDYFTLTKTGSGESGGEGTKEIYKESFDSNFDAATLGDGWECVELKDGGYALQGTKDSGGLLAALPMTSELPAEYTIVADVALVKGLNGSGYSAGVTFQQSEDGKNFYHFRLNRDGADKAVDTQLYQWNPSAKKLKTGTNIIPDYADGQFHKLTVTVSGTKITGYVDGTKAFDYTAESDVLGGKVGLRVYNAVVQFDNIVVKSGVHKPEEEPSAPQTAIFVNQIGYDNGTSMRATIPNADGKKFQVMQGSGTDNVADTLVFTGEVVGGIADFTGELTPTTDTTYYITCDGKRSYDFEVGTNLIQRRSVKQALDFMVQTRSDQGVMGNNSIAWRDGHQFSFELNGLVLQYMANPSVYDNMPKTIFAEDTYVGTHKLTGTEYDDLQTQNEPDIIWLIKFAARRYYSMGTTTREYSVYNYSTGKHEKTELGPQKLHMLTKEQLAYYLYLAPELIARGWEDKEFYQKVRDYTISVWDESTCDRAVEFYPVYGTNHDLYSVQTKFGGLKGSQPMGHSIVPNLMMYEVAKRDGLGDAVAEKFLTAAVENCKYTIGEHEANKDANGKVINDICDPFFCKGQRMSEYVTIPALDYFVEMCPGEEALKAQIKAKIADWAKVNIARGDNLWDIRKAVSAEAGDLKNYQFHNPYLTDKTIKQEYWTGAAYANADNQVQYLSGGAPKNEPGNQAGLQAVMYAAARVLKYDTLTADRLHALGVAAIDDLFGRNPTGMAAFYDFRRDFTGADLGWYTYYPNGAGYLNGCTAVIDANAPEFCYQNDGYNPSKDYQNNPSLSYTEGWVAYNTAWNASLAYNQAENVSLTVDTANGTKVGDTVNVTLTAPIDMDTAKAETGTVWVTNETTGDRTCVTVTESSKSSTTFTGSFDLPNAQSVTVSYGSGLFAHTQTITVEGYQEVETTALRLSADKTEAEVGETVKLTVTFEPENTTDRTVDFTSSNEDVATVDANGVVTLHAAGMATITAELHSNRTITGTVTLTVKEAEQRSYEFGLLDLFKKGKYTYTGDANQAPKEIEDHTNEIPVYGKSRVKLYDGTVTFDLGEIPAGRYMVALYAKHFPGGTYANIRYERYGTWKLSVNDTLLKEIDFGTNQTGGAYTETELGHAMLNGATTLCFESVDQSGPVTPVYVKLTCIVDLTRLLEAIKNAEALKGNQNEYTEDSWDVFEKALEAAKTVYNDSTATQDAVNAATDALNAAIAKLEKKPTIDSDDAIGALLPLLPALGSDTQVTFPFNDVSKADWYYNSVRSAWYNGLIDGVTRYEFQPDSTLTVAQAIKLAAAFYQMEHEGKVRLTNGETKWYDTYVSYAIANGIIEQSYASYTDAQMNAPVTRDEFVHIFHGAKDGYTAISTVADGAIPDVKTTDKYAAEIYELYRAGILTGSDAKGTFHAASTIKRSEAAAILLRMYDSSVRVPINLK